VTDGGTGVPEEAPDARALRHVAEECVTLVAQEHGHELDWSPESLEALDAVCAELVAEGPLAGDRLRLWRMLAGAYTGEVVVRAYDGSWVTHDGQTAVRALGIVGFPFGTAHRILTGEPFKSLASFARVLPTIAERSREDSRRDGREGGRQE
jgi:hypothetical protein